MDNGFRSCARAFDNSFCYVKTMKFETDTINGTYTRLAWLFQPADILTDKLCIFLDAELYLGGIDAVTLVGQMMYRGEIPPVACVFVSHLNSEARHYDYTCSDNYTEFIATEVLDWARLRIPGLTAGGHIVCGLSLSGLAAAFCMATRPDVFAAAVCQSPSFWWSDEKFAAGAVEANAIGGAHWISVGDKETEFGVSHEPTGLRQNTSQLDSCRNAVQILTRLGCQISFNIFSGGHEIEPWKAELPSAIKWALQAGNHLES